MERFEHGGDVHAHEGALDFSASLNPLGMPEGVRRALLEGVDACSAYPDPYCRRFVSAIAECEGVPAGQVLACAGATDAISRVCLALRPRRALVCAPCYSGYEQALGQAGARVARHVLEEEAGFGVDDSIVGALEGIDAVFLANPNNPTGLTVGASLVERIVAQAAAREAVVVVDESFLDFTREPSATRLFETYRNVVVVKSLTKMYAMAGVRAGYLLSPDAAIAKACAEAGQPWAVSTPAQLAGIAALSDGEFSKRSRAYVDARRNELAAGLAGLGLRVVPGEANYLMFECARPLYAPLLERGFLIRRCENFHGLDSRWYRTAVRTRGENAALLAAMGEVLA